MRGNIREIFKSVNRKDVSIANEHAAALENNIIGRYCGTRRTHITAYLSVINCIKENSSRVEMNCLEIGSFFGGSAIMKLMALRDAKIDGKMVCVDPQNYGVDKHSGVEVCTDVLFENLRKFGFKDQDIELRQFDSTDPRAYEGLDREFDIVLIDGDHTYDYVINDWKKTAPLCRGCVLFDDFTHQAWPDVQKAVKDIRNEDFEGWEWLGQVWGAYTGIVRRLA